MPNRMKTPTLNAASATMQTCVGCHATYRQQIVDDATWNEVTSRPLPKPPQSRRTFTLANPAARARSAVCATMSDSISIGMHHATYAGGQRHCEGTVAAAQLDHIPSCRCESEHVENQWEGNQAASSRLSPRNREGAHENTVSQSG